MSKGRTGGGSVGETCMRLNDDMSSVMAEFESQKVVPMAQIGLEQGGPGPGQRVRA